MRSKSQDLIQTGADVSTCEILLIIMQILNNFVQIFFTTVYTFYALLCICW